jgi:hypothetical protein
MCVCVYGCVHNVYLKLVVVVLCIIKGIRVIKYWW